MLRSLNLHGCSNLKLLPRCLGDLQGLHDLNLSECQKLERLPEGMIKLSNLKALSMDFCSQIATLCSTDDGELGANLIKFSALGASSLTKLPESFSRFSLLEELWLSGCRSLSELPQSMKGLAKLRFILVENSGLTHLPTDFGELQSLRELHIISCDALKSLPGSFGRLKGLTSLLMRDNKLTKLPNSFKDLTTLAILDIRGSWDLANVDALPAFIEELELGDCPQLVCVDLHEKVKKLRKLSLYNCTRLTQLRGLESSECTVLEKIDVYRCRSLLHLYENQVSNPNLRECYLSGSGVCLPYHNDWSQTRAPSCQVISYYDHAIGFVENTMTRKICSVRDANELCVETRISRKESGMVEGMVNSFFYRTCDTCETLIKGQRGWHCNVCNDFDVCETCFKESETENWELPPPHQLDHPMSVFQSPNQTKFEPILMPYEEGVDKYKWGYIVYDYPTVRWCETFEYIR